MPDRRIPFSVVVITLNESARLARCFEGLEFADELLVVDSGSSDDTVRVAQSLGARVIHQDWLGYGAQKQFAVDQARHDWVLCLDADEQLSAGLAAEIRQRLATQPDVAGFDFPRCNRFMGRWLRHGEGYPDRSLRLFDRRQGHWGNDRIHEAVQLDGALGHLAGDLLHRSEESLGQYLEKQNRYTDLQVDALFERGKRAGVGKLLVNPLWRFFKFYVLKRGFLDGVPGFVHIVIGCFNSFSKYAKLIALRRQSD